MLGNEKFTLEHSACETGQFMYFENTYKYISAAFMNGRLIYVVHMHCFSVKLYAFSFNNSPYNS